MIFDQYPAYFRNEITFLGSLSVGSKGIAVRRTQEWLSYHGFQTTIDGSFGPATERACRSFQTARGLKRSGQIDQTSWSALVSPLVAAVSEVSGLGNSFDVACLKVAKQHVEQNPIELGGTTAARGCAPT